jgi:thiol-disulfide isomerase/thioredoxin
MAFLNQFSFLLLAAGLLLVLVLYLRRRGPAEGTFMAVLALFVGLAFAFVFFRPIESEGVSNQTSEQLIANREPVLLEFQSPYCVACMAVEPLVKQIEFDHQGELEVVRLNVLERDVGPLLQRYGFQYTPTFIFLDAQGEEVWRTVGVLDPEQVAYTLEELR